MLLSEARDQILKFLDDADGDRWTKLTTTFSTSNEVDLALQSAANECMSLYAAMGGDFYDVTQSIQVVNGTYSFVDSQPVLPNVPLMIRGVSLKEGTSYYNIYATREQDIEEESSDTQDIKVRVIYQPNFTGFLASDVLRFSRNIGGVQLNWSLFEQWVCAVAAKHLAPKENEANAQLDARIMMLKDACIKAPEAPMAVTFPRSDRGFRSSTAFLYRWSYSPRDEIANKITCFRLHRVSFR